jgi:surface antigen
MKKGILAIAVFGWLLFWGSGPQAQEGDELDEAEEQAMNDALQYALEKNPSHEAAEWVNPDTGRAGAVVPLKTFGIERSRPCREFVTTIIIGGNEEQGYGTACRQPDGSWEIVAEDRELPSAPSAPQPSRVYVYPAPRAYYGYPPEVYGPHRIFVSFSTVYRVGRIHYGSHYLDASRFRNRHPLDIRKRVYVGPRVHRHYHGRDGREHRRREEYRERDRRREGDRPDGRWSDPDRSGRDRRRR